MSLTIYNLLLKLISECETPAAECEDALRVLPSRHLKYLHVCNLVIVTEEMDKKKYCVTFEPQIPLENGQTGRERKDAEAIMSHRKTEKWGADDQKKDCCQPCHPSEQRTQEASGPFSTVVGGGAPGPVTWLHAKVGCLTTATSSWTWSAAGTSCGSGQGRRRCTRCTGGSNSCDYPLRSSPRGPSALLRRSWRNKEGTLWNSMAPGFSEDSVQKAQHPLKASAACLRHYFLSFTRGNPVNHSR